MNIGLNSLNNPSINGLQSLSLDELIVNTIDGDLFYIDRVELYPKFASSTFIGASSIS